MKKKISLTTKILIGLFLGFICGLILKSIPDSYIKDTIIIGGILKIFGTGFTTAIKMMVVPLVFVSLVCGTSSMGDIKKLGRIGTKTMAFYLSTTAVAIIIALFLGSVLKPGAGLDMSHMVSGEVSIGESKSLVDIILGIVPSNPIKAFADGEMLQIIFFAMITGIAMSIVGKKAEPVRVIFESLNEICMKMVGIIMLFAPYGVFALVCDTFSSVGQDAILVLIKYVAVFLSGGVAMVLPLIFNFWMTLLVVPAILPDVTMNMFYGVFGGSFLAELYYTVPFLYVAIYLFIDFVYCGFLVCICMAVSGIVRQKWGVVLIPFLLLLFVHVITDYIYSDPSVAYKELSPLYFLRGVEVRYSFSGSIILLFAIGLLVISLIGIIKEYRNEIY